MPVQARRPSATERKVGTAPSTGDGIDTISISVVVVVDSPSDVVVVSPPSDVVVDSPVAVVVVVVVS